MRRVHKLHYSHSKSARAIYATGRDESLARIGTNPISFNSLHNAIICAGKGVHNGVIELQSYTDDDVQWGGFDLTWNNRWG